MSKKNKIELGTFSNECFGSIPLEIDKATYNRMCEIFNDDKTKLNNYYDNLVYRLDAWLKKNDLAIPDKEDFIRFIIDNKSITHHGKSLPKISDDQLIKYAKEYSKRLQALIVAKEQQVELPIWKIDQDLVPNLFKLLSDNLIDEAEREKFIGVFTNKPPRQKVDWKSTTTLLIYFIDQLIEKGVISRNFSFAKFLENNFLTNGKVVSNIKQAKENIKNAKKGKPNNYQIIDNILIALLEVK